MMLMLSRTWLDIWAHWNLEVAPANSSKSGINQTEVQRERRFNGSAGQNLDHVRMVIKDVSATRAADWRLPSPHPDSAHRPAIVCEAGLLSPAAGFLMENDG